MDRSYTTHYQSLFDVEYYRDLEMLVKGNSRSLKMVPFKSMGTVFSSPSIVTTVASLAISEIFNVEEMICGFGAVQGH